MRAALGFGNSQTYPEFDDLARLVWVERSQCVVLDHKAAYFWYEGCEPGSLEHPGAWLTTQPAPPSV